MRAITIPPLVVCCSLPTQNKEIDKIFYMHSGLKNLNRNFPFFFQRPLPAASSAESTGQRPQLQQTLLEAMDQRLDRKPDL